MSIEYRRVSGLHVRVTPDRKEGRIVADVMVYNKIDDYRTSFAPGAFAESLRDHLPKMLWAHNMMEPIGRWIEVDDNSQRLRMVGELDLDMVTTRDGRELDIPAVPMAHRAWTQLQKRTIDQFSVGFMRLNDSPHLSVRGATQIDRAWLDEASPVLVGSVPGTALVSTRAAVVQGDATVRRIFAVSTRRPVFNRETRANPTGYNQYKHMSGSSRPSGPSSPPVLKNADGQPLPVQAQKGPDGKFIIPTEQPRPGGGPDGKTDMSKVDALYSSKVAPAIAEQKKAHADWNASGQQRSGPEFQKFEATSGRAQGLSKIHEQAKYKGKSAAKKELDRQAAEAQREGYNASNTNKSKNTVETSGRARAAHAAGQEAFTDIYGNA